MKDFLNGIRSAKNGLPLKRKVLDTAAVTLLGVILGAVSKFLDELPVSNPLLEYLDISNFLGRFAIWLFIALCISVYSLSSVRAGINVFMFFAGMVLSYYLYSTYISGFFPKSYAMIWACFTVISPFLAFICWYAKGEGKVSLIISSLILSVLFNASFVYGVGYFNWISPLEAVTFVCGFFVLRRKTLRGSAVMAGISLAVAVVVSTVFIYAL